MKRIDRARYRLAKASALHHTLTLLMGEIDAYESCLRHGEGPSKGLWWISDNTGGTWGFWIQITEYPSSERRPTITDISCEDNFNLSIQH